MHVEREPGAAKPADDDIADRRDTLATRRRRSGPPLAVRVHLLNQVTLQLWLVFGATLILLGLALARLEPTLAIALSVEGRPLPRSLWWPVVLGVIVDLCGAALILAAGARYVRREREIDQWRFERHGGLLALTVAGTVAMAIALAVYLVLLQT